MEQGLTNVAVRLSLAGPGSSGISATVADAAAAARRLDDAGFDYIMGGDTVWRDLYPQLAVLAQSTQRITLGPTCTNPATRHPFVTAQAIATVDEISGGRACLGIGTGQSAIEMCGLPPPTWAHMRRALVIIASAQRRAREFEPWPPGVEIDEAVTELMWVKRRVPVLVVAGGPKGGRCAAEMADGIMFRAGDVTWSQFPERMAQLRAWREAGPRAGDPFEVQMTLPSYITGSPDGDEIAQARRLLGPVVAAMAHASMTESRLPDHLVEAWRVFKSGYDYSHHVSSANRNNDDLMAELGLADYFFEQYSLVGAPEALVERLVEMQAMGITAVGVGFGHSVDPVEAREQFDRAAETRRLYLERIGPRALASGPLAARPAGTSQG